MLFPMSEEERRYYQTANCTNYDLLKAFAKEMRNNPTEAESVLWEYLRYDTFNVRFRRQYIIGDYIADFCCLSKKLVIELDGGYHNLPDQQISDAERTAKLNSLGFEVVRFNNEEVLFDTDNVLLKIQRYIDS